MLTFYSFIGTTEPLLSVTLHTWQNAAISRHEEESVFDTFNHVCARNDMYVSFYHLNPGQQ